jgi:hypothetical protein
LAYARLAAIYSNLNESVREIEFSKKAFDLKTRVSERGGCTLPGITIRQSAR